MPRECYDDFRAGHRDRNDRYPTQNDNKNYDPEYDARNYQGRSRRTGTGVTNSSDQRNIESSAGDRRSERDDTRYPTRDYQDPSEKEMRDHHRERKSKKKSKHKRKRSHDRDDKRKKTKTKALVEYDDVSSSSDMYSAGELAQSPLSASNRASPVRDSRYRRGESPASAIKSYQKHIRQRGHSNSPVKGRSPNRTSTGAASTSTRVKKEGRTSPESARSYPKSYSDAPRAYQTPSPTRRTNRHRVPSPYSRRRSSSPHSRLVKFTKSYTSCQALL